MLQRNSCRRLQNSHKYFKWKDFLSEEFRAACLEIIPFPDLVEPNECSDAFVYLKTNICIPNSVSLNSDD